ncbi:MAG: creatininase family protein [Planctomycetaceae bacterium]|nr:creatininase family protein [Planctomycetaceae bacterium]
MLRFAGLSLLAFVTLQAATKPDPVAPDPDGLRPIPAADTLRIEDMTWMEVRDALKAGKTTVIIATGGIEQNGPYLVTGKHNVVLRGTTEAIARQLGNALIAPIVPFVPEGDIDPPTVHMKYPGTVSVTEATYQALLTDICRSFRTHGFKHIVLIGDSGGNQAGMEAVAKQLNDQWNSEKSRVHYVPEYYDFAAVTKWLEDQGIRQQAEGYHDDFGMTAMMMAVDPASVRTKERIAAGKFSINGVKLAPAKKTIKWGHRIINFRAAAAVKSIKEKTGA